MSHTLNRTAEQFWANVDKTPTGCWLWRGGRKHAKPSRYAIATVNGKTAGVHRIAYELAKGEIPPKRLVMHSCDTPLCINPDHLGPGTPKDNMQDMSRKGRSVRGTTRPGTGPAGQRNSHAVLTPEIVATIRADRAVTGLSIYKLAEKYGIGKSQAYNIISGSQWKGHQ